jgi:prevent-host-death family protein
MSDTRDTYSLYEAKAKLSAIIRRVREGRRVVVTVHGEPVAEIRPVEQRAGDLAARLEHLVESRIVVRAERRGTALRPVARKPGALARFLADRDA